MKFWQLLAWTYFIVVSRNLLECLTDNGGKIADFNIIFISYPVYYFLCFTAVTLVIYAFCRTEILMIFKTVGLFSFFVFIAPVVDYIFPLYQNQSYGLVNSWDYFFRAYYTLGLGELYLQGASFGVKMEFLLVLFGVAAYLLLKKKNFILALGGGFFAYAALLTVGFTQTYINLAYRLLGQSYSDNLSVLAFVLLALLAAAGAAVFIIHDRAKFFAWLKSINYFRGALMTVILGLGFMLFVRQRLTAAAFTADLPLHLIKISAACLAAFLAWQIARLFNDLADCEADRLNGSENILNRFSREETVGLFLIYLLFFIGLALVVGYHFFALLILPLGLSYFYSFAPMQLKKHFVTASLTCSLSYLLVFFAGYSILFTPADSLNFIPKDIVYLFFIIFALAISFKDVKDESGDRCQGRVTLYTVFGRAQALWIVRLLILAAALLPALFLGEWPLLITGLLAYLTIWGVTRGFNDIGAKKSIFVIVIAYIIVSGIFVSAARPERLFGSINLDRDLGWHPKAEEEIWFLSAYLGDAGANQYFLSQTFIPKVGTYLTLIGINDHKIIKEFYPAKNNLAVTKNEFRLIQSIPGYIQSDQITARKNYGFGLQTFFAAGLANLNFKNQPLAVLLASPSGAISLANQSLINYFALPNLQVSGKIVFKNEKKLRVQGIAWLEHFWGSPKIDYQRWATFNASLDNGAKLTINLFDYGQSGLIYGAWLKDGKTQTFSRLEIKPLAIWKNPATGNEWLSEFEISSPEQGFKLHFQAPFSEQEVAGQNIWEGLMFISGDWSGQTVKGWSNYRQVGPLAKPPAAENKN